ncbi:MAG: Holliday junction resolvase RuvX [Armatimonadetes bacterium]|nr:Holliday junction resolvase RuvX [Armatimonadota bacterium]
MRVLGVDYGIKRIGVAIGESEVSMGFARNVILGSGTPELDARLVADFSRSEGCDVVLVGLPYLESGDEGEQVRLTREFAEHLQGLCVRVEFWDERYTTASARSNLAHVEPGKRKRLLDSEAARIMVTEYLAH